MAELERKIWFWHVPLKNKDVPEQPEQPDEPDRSTSRNGHVTIALVLSETKATVAVAWCSPRDQFSKKLGRTIAGGRLRKYLSFDHPEEGQNPKKLAEKKKDYRFATSFPVVLEFGPGSKHAAKVLLADAWTTICKDLGSHIPLWVPTITEHPLW